MAAVFTAHGTDVTPESFVAGFRPALAVAAGLSLIGAVTALGVRRGWTQEREPNTVGFSRTAR